MNLTNFNTLNNADGFIIQDVPWVGYCQENKQVVYCKEENKKLVVNNNTIETADAGPEMVDLGLSVKWMKYNIGVDPNHLDNAEDWYGGYYAWAETSGRTVDYEQETCSPSCDWGHYKYYANGTITKYNETDGLTTLQAGDDAATVAYGSNFRMPTKAELEELKGLQSEWVTNYGGITGLKGRLFHGTGAYSANTLFIPATGYCEGGGLRDVANNSYVWSSSLHEYDSRSAWYLDFNSGRVGMSNFFRYYGYSVRGVSRA